jgi:hypothetical protein
MPELRIPAPWIAGLVAVLALAILALAFVLLRGGDAGDGLSAADLSAEFAPRAIAADELFLPAEPDFLPALIRYREPKTAWTAADAAPYWTDPAKLDPAPLAAAAAAAVDALLETVP